MSYIVFCTFDLKNASSQDYQNAYADLERIGLKKVTQADGGRQAVIPTTSAMGKLPGVNAATLRNDIQNRVNAAFTARRFKSEIFIVVGDNWAWGAGTT
jgi:hypothetical protein